MRRQAQLDGVFAARFFEHEDSDPLVSRRRRIPRWQLSVPGGLSPLVIERPTRPISVPAILRSREGRYDEPPCTFEDDEARPEDRPTLPAVTRIPPEARRSAHRLPALRTLDMLPANIAPAPPSYVSRALIALAFLGGIAIATAAAAWIHRAESAIAAPSRMSR